VPSSKRPTSIAPARSLSSSDRPSRQLLLALEQLHVLLELAEDEVAAEPRCGRGGFGDEDLLEREGRVPELGRTLRALSVDVLGEEERLADAVDVAEVLDVPVTGGHGTTVLLPQDGRRVAQPRQDLAAAALHRHGRFVADEHDRVDLVLVGLLPLGDGWVGQRA
jgi:hypothetical protein